MTPLHLAAEIGHIKKVTYLCDNGADINIQDNDAVKINAGRLAIEPHFKKVYESNSWLAFKLQKSW